MQAWRWIAGISSRHVAVRGDEEALSQVVLNLLLNAIEAAQQNGLAQTDRGHVCVEVGITNSDEAELIIADSGAGPAESVPDRCSSRS